MLQSKLIHLHPTRRMLTEELREAGIPCVTKGNDREAGFHSVCLYQGEPPREGILYILEEEYASLLPGAVFPCAASLAPAGNIGWLACPGLTATALTGKLMDIFFRYRTQEHELDELVFRNVGLYELCDFGAKLLGNPVCIHDDWFILIAMSQDLPQAMPPDSVMSSSRKFIPTAIVDDFRDDKEYLETFAHRNAQYWHSDDAGSCLYVNLWDGDVYLGRMLVLEQYRPFLQRDYMIAEFFTQRASMLLQRLRSGKRASYRSSDDVMRELLAGTKPDPSDEAQLYEMLGWSKSDKLVVLRLNSRQEVPTLVQERALHSDLFRIFPGSYIMFEGHQQCVVLNMTRSPMTLPGLRDILTPLCQDYRLYAGISSPVYGVRELNHAYRQSDVALNQAFRLRSSRYVVSFSDCAMDYVLGNLSSPLPHMHIASPELRLLLDHDRENGTRYFETLRVYLLQERDIPRTAKELIIHRTTLLYRLRKIQDITALNLEDPGQRLYLLFSLWILDKELQSPKT